MCEHGSQSACPHLCSFLREQDIFVATDEIHQILAQIFSVPINVPEVITSVIKQYNFINVKLTNTVSDALFRYAARLVAKSLGATISDWLTPVVVAGSNSRDLVQKYLDESESGSTLFASIILGIAYRNRELALEFVTFVSKNSVAASQKRKYKDELDVFGVIRDSVRNKDAGAMPWSVKISSFAPIVFAANRHLSWIQAHPDWAIEYPHLESRGRRARKLVEMLGKGQMTVAQFATEIKKTTACICGVSWNSILLERTNSVADNIGTHAMVCVTYQYCGAGGCGICAEY